MSISNVEPSTTATSTNSNTKPASGSGTGGSTSPASGSGGSGSTPSSGSESGGKSWLDAQANTSETTAFTGGSSGSGDFSQGNTFGAIVGGSNGITAALLWPLFLVSGLVGLVYLWLTKKKKGGE